MESYQLPQISEAECLRNVCSNERVKKGTAERGTVDKKGHSGVLNLVCHYRLNAKFFALLLLFCHNTSHQDQSCSQDFHS